MNSTLEVVEFAREIGRGGSSGEVIVSMRGGEKERIEDGGESGNILDVNAE